MISLHFIVDNADDRHLDRGLLYLKRTKQRTVGIGAGAQLLRGQQFVERVKAEVPGITVFWRDLDPEDTGIHSKMTADELYAHKVAKHRTWFLKNRPVFMPDNESSGDDGRIKAYVDWQVKVGNLLHADGLNGAFCRFATGNIDDGSKVSNQYPLLKPIFDMMLPGDYISPNEYSNAPGKSSGGHLARYRLMYDVAKRKLPTVIGEASIADDYRSDKGFRSVPNIGGRQLAEQMLNEEVWYEDGAIDRHAYMVGGFGWPNFQLIDAIVNGQAQSEFLDTLEGYYARNQPPVVVQPPPPPPPPPTDPTVVTPMRMDYPAVAIIEGFKGALNLRSGPGIHHQDVGDVFAGDKLTVFQGTISVDRGLKWIYVRTKTGKPGWIALLEDVGLRLTGDKPDIVSGVHAAYEEMRVAMSQVLARATDAQAAAGEIKAISQSALQQHS